MLYQGRLELLRMIYHLPGVPAESRQRQRGRCGRWEMLAAMRRERRRLARNERQLVVEIRWVLDLHLLVGVQMQVQ